ncbi:MAG: HEAT repeat domain-containing protein [Planctomycetes bacterium]|nr:HEAT repeat domain-containing protein [Planctomycetota bacterium]
MIARRRASGRAGPNAARRLCALSFLALWPCALCLVGLSAGEAAPAFKPAELERLVAQLKSEVFGERQQALESLRQAGTAVLPYLAKLDVTGDPDLKWRLTTLRQAVALAESPGLEERLREIVRTYPLQQPEERAAAVSELAQRGHAAAVPALLELMKTEQDPGALEAIVRELGWLPLPPEAGAPLRELYGRGDLAEPLRAMTLWALAQDQGPASLKLVREALESPRELLRLQAIRVLSLRLRDPESMPALRKLAIGDGEVPAAIRGAALTALRDMLDPEAAPVFKHALEADDRELKLGALNGLAGLRDAASVPLLVEMYAKPENQDLQDFIVDTLGAIADPAALPTLKSALKHDSAAVRISALHALVALNAREAAPEIAACLKDADPDVLQAATSALGHFEYKEALPQIRALNLSEVREGEIEKAQALANLGDPAGIETLIRIAEGRGAAAQTALRLLADWRVREALPVFRSKAADGDDQALHALYKLEHDRQSFERIVRRALLIYRGEGRGGYAASVAAGTFERLGLTDRALRILEAELRKPEPEIGLLHQVANACHEVGRYADAQAAFERISRGSEEDVGYFNNHAWFYATSFLPEYRRTGEALALATRAVSMEPREDYIVDTYGWALHAAGHYEAAARELRRALELKAPADKPGRAWQRTRLARSVWAAGRHDEARALVGQALEDARRDERVWFEAAGFYAAIGARDESVHALHVAVDYGWLNWHAMELNPEFAALKEDFGYTFAIRRAKQELQRLERIVDRIAEAAVPEPDSVTPEPSIDP